MRRTPSASTRAFTLIELAVSVAVLTLIVVLVSQLMNSATATVGNSGKHMDSDTQARLLFNRLGVEFGRMVKRPDVDYSSFKQPAGSLSSQYNNASIAANLQAGNDQLAFYSETEGYFSGATQPSGAGKAAVSLVAYNMANDPNTSAPVNSPYDRGTVLRRMGARGSGGIPAPPELGGAWCTCR